jgi:hypothetical protein
VIGNARLPDGTCALGWQRTPQEAVRPRWGGNVLRTVGKATEGVVSMDAAVARRKRRVGDDPISPQNCRMSDRPGHVTYTHLYSLNCHSDFFQSLSYDLPHASSIFPRLVIY